MGKAWMLSPHDSEEGLATLAQCSHSVLYWRPESESHPAAAKSLVMSKSLQSHGLCSPGNSPDQNTGVVSLYFLQGILPTKGLNPGRLHCRWILYQLSYQGSPSQSNKTKKKKKKKTYRLERKKQNYPHSQRHECFIRKSPAKTTEN